MNDGPIGIAGVGLMGHGIATNIAKAGHALVLLDHPGNQPTGELVASGARLAATPKALAQACATIILCVSDTRAVEAVISGGDGLLEGLSPGTLVIDCSTSLPVSTRKMASLVDEAGGRMLDAPMTRTPKEAAEGRLNLIVGGEQSLFEEALPLFRCFAENIVHAGGIGAGHTLKLLHNFVSLGFSALLSEAFAASAGAGIEAAVLVDVLSNGGGAGVVLERLAPYALERDGSGFRFSLANSRKDLDYYTEFAKESGAATTIAEAVLATFTTQTKQGHEARSIAELMDLLA